MIRTLDDLITSLRRDRQLLLDSGDQRLAAIYARIIAQAESVRVHTRWAEEDARAQGRLW